jgi:hypothetical protein
MSLNEGLKGVNISLPTEKNKVFIIAFCKRSSAILYFRHCGQMFCSRGMWLDLARFLILHYFTDSDKSRKNGDSSLSGTRFA